MTTPSSLASENNLLARAATIYRLLGGAAVRREAPTTFGQWGLDHIAELTVTPGIADARAVNNKINHARAYSAAAALLQTKVDTLPRRIQTSVFDRFETLCRFLAAEMAMIQACSALGVSTEDVVQSWAISSLDAELILISDALQTACGVDKETVFLR